MFVAFLALIWVPLTAHCQLESATGLDFLGCGSAEQSDAQGGPCCDDSLCCAWENGPCSLPQNFSSELPCGAVLETIPLVHVKPPQGSSFDVPKLAPPYLCKIWQFLSRAALPVRAPSVAS